MEEAKILIAAVAVSVTRDPMTIIEREVPAHEVEVLHAVFGADNVQQLERAVDPIALDPASEADRLSSKYGTGSLETAFGANFKTAIPKAAKEHAVKPAKAGKAASE